LGPELDEKPVILGGLITALRRSVTKRGQMMAYFKLEDLTGTVDVLVFPRNFTELAPLLAEDQVAVNPGKIS